MDRYYNKCFHGISEIGNIDQSFLLDLFESELKNDKMID